MPTPCRLTRTELHRLLQECGYGRDTDMFACYFYRLQAALAEDAAASGGGSPVMCLTCRCAVGDHDDDAGGGGTDGTGGAVVGKLVPEEAVEMMPRRRGGGPTIADDDDDDGGGRDGDQRANVPLLLLGPNPTVVHGRAPAVEGPADADDPNILRVEPATLYFPAPQDRRARNTVRITNTSTTKAVSLGIGSTAPERCCISPQLVDLGPGQQAAFRVTLFDPSSAPAPDAVVRVHYTEAHSRRVRTITLRIDTTSVPPASAALEYLAPVSRPPPLPPGLVADPQVDHDTVTIDDSGVAWRVWVAAHVVSLVAGVPFVALDDYKYGPGAMSIVGMVLLSTTWGLSVFAALMIMPVVSFFDTVAQIYTVRIDPPSDGGGGGGGTSNGNRTLWVDRVVTRWRCCCCCEPEKPVRIKELKAVRVQRNPVTAETRVTLHRSVGVVRDIFGNVTDALLVYHGKCDDPESAAHAWRAYLEPDAPERLDVETITVYNSDSAIADPPPLPPGMESRDAKGYDELAVNGGVGTVAMRVLVAVAVACVIAGSVMTPVGVWQQQAVYEAIDYDYRHYDESRDYDADAGLGLIISGAILLGLGLLALPALFCLHCCCRYTLRVSHPQGGPDANAAGYGARTLWVEYPADRWKAHFGCHSGSRPPCPVDRVTSVVRVDYHPITQQATVALHVSCYSSAVFVFEGKAATEADAEAIADAWRAYLRPDAPDRLRAPGAVTTL